MTRKKEILGSFAHDPGVVCFTITTSRYPIAVLAFCNNNYQNSRAEFLALICTVSSASNHVDDYALLLPWVKNVTREIRRR